MLSKIRSLSFKLTISFFISVFLIVGATIGYIEYHKYEIAAMDAFRDVEIGPGFLNGATPDNTDAQILYNNPDSAYNLKLSDVEKGFMRFKPLLDINVEGGVSVISSITGPVNINNQEYYNLAFDVLNIKSGYQYEVGPVTIPKSQFPATIAVYNSNTQNQRLNEFYYLPIPGNNNLIWVVSANSYNSHIRSWQSQIGSDLLFALPFSLLLSIIFILLIIWIIILPIRHVTQAIELFSRSDLSQRVQAKSGDEIGRLAKSFNTMADRLEESFNSQKRFISDAAHELRTPLASLKTAVTRTLSSEKSIEDYQSLLGFLSGRINDMENLVNDLLFLSRVDEGQFKPALTSLDISKVLAESEEAFQYLFEDKGINFVAGISPELHVNGDRTLILRVIANLLDNAAKNTPAGGLVSLRGNKQEKDIVITVSDTGSGIPPEHLPHIFNRFYRISYSSSGYGLGLAISQSIILSLGGKISVQSEIGKGCIFTIKLPSIES
jgi:two-component system, OmpR family, heavy metal sensor histidine kinase CusS